MSIVEMIVHMDCAGCERKIKKALRKLDGVNEVDIDLNMQKVTVMGWVEQEKVLKTMRKMGRRADLWPYPQDPEYYNIMRQYNYHQHRDLDQNQSLNYYVSLPKYSSYNDHIHGYSSTTAQLGYGSYDDQHHHQSLSSSYDDQQPPYSTMYRDQNDWQATAIFNDENPHACSIM